MTYSPCLLIPIYNHGQTIGAMVERLSAYGLPLFIIDDGSNETTQAVLAEVSKKFPLTKLHRLPENRGKGAAAMQGMKEAFEAGFTHILQIDADGQHDTADVPRFIEAGAKNPQAVICGKPIYDASVPKARLYGRYLTHFWVYIETLGCRADSMCGFRLYPLAATCALMRRARIPTRMNFDTEIFVRLIWEGLAFENLPTKVIYPVGGVSHFHVWRDNARISWMHTRLFFGMLRRLPLLLRRKYSRRSRC
jgi:glycosyltransferase involved in cell wall biosynthesis